MQRSFISQWVGYMAVLEFRTKLEVSGDQSHARADRAVATPTLLAPCDSAVLGDRERLPTAVLD